MTRDKNHYKEKRNSSQTVKFLETLSSKGLRKNPISLGMLLKKCNELLVERDVREKVNELMVEVFQVIFSQKDDFLLNSEDQLSSMYMSIQLKLYFNYRENEGGYTTMIRFTNTRQHDLALKKEVSESMAFRIFQSLSHEFGTYMNIICNVTENALEDPSVSTDLKKDYFRIIHTNSLLLENIIKDMRNFFAITTQ